MSKSRSLLVAGLVFVSLAAVAAGRSASTGTPSVNCVIRDGVMSLTATNSAADVLSTSMAIEYANAGDSRVEFDLASPWAVTWTEQADFIAGNPGAFIGKAVFDMGDHVLEVTGPCTLK